MNYSIVQVGSGDTALIAEIAALELICFSEPWSAHSFISVVNSDSAAVFAALGDDGGVLGYSVVFIAADEGELANIAVAPDARRNGIAGEMLSRSLGYIAERGAVCCYLEVRASNTAAQKLYSNAGFVPVGIRRGYYRSPAEDAILMKR